MTNNISFDVLADENDRKYRAPALEKGLDILELLARNGAPMTTSQMAMTLGRSVSELFRMVLALEFRGYIESSSEGREGYVLTNKLFTLGIAQGSTRSLLETALPVMKDLVHELGQSCHLVVPSGDQIVVVGRIESPMDLGFSVRVGYRRLLVDTNSGMLLYGFSSEETRTRWLPQLRDSSDAETIERFLQKSKLAVERGYVQSASDFVEGITDNCVPILGLNGASAVLNVPFINIKSQPIKHEQVIERLKVSARKIADVLSNEER
jgi:DNA-binding IclR family transcriptional regulator